MLNRRGTAVIAGASSGIGAAYTNRLADQGYDLILIDQHRDALNQAAAIITDNSRRAVEVLATDLTVPHELNRVERALRQDASITLLVNAAGNTAATRLAYALAPGFAARGIGTIINVASMTALAPFVLSLSQALQRQFGRHGVHTQAALLFMGKCVSPSALVDAALAGLVRGEHVTLPCLADQFWTLH
ncbi:MAG: Short-chain dehydrogenase/reductase [Pseudomonas sp.]|nr:Short-chain dehydrogenase/reductase [Pseudomonas sp.]